MMKIETFRIINCFGFKDSGKVNLRSPHNLIYILGRNSSGKSSLLNSLKYFSNGIVPKDQPNFYNFKMTGEVQEFIAEFSLDKDLDFANFMVDILEEVKQKYRIPENVWTNQNSQLYKLYIIIKEHYTALIEKINANGRVIVEKIWNGNYYFLAKEGDYQEYNGRKNLITNTINGIVGSNKTITVSGSKYSFGIEFKDIENLLFLKFPRIVLFNEVYSLNDSLPDRITADFMRRKDKSALEGAFLKFLGEEQVNRFLASNDPDDQKDLITALQQRVNELVQKVNSYEGKVGQNADLIEIVLHERNGLQLTFKTDGKKSFYSHLSENTKFLFAYYLYQEAIGISGDILLFDEPNNGFHPTAQEFLLNFLKSLTGKSQVVISTHSEYLIDPDYFTGIRVMGIDEDKYIYVKNHVFDAPRGKGNYLALQPILSAIGLKYGRQINIREKVIITEGLTDMFYLRAFNLILSLGLELSIAPARGDSTILSLIPLFISQDIGFKIILDKGNVRSIIVRDYGIPDEYIWEVPVPTAFEDKMAISGIEDLFTKEDFKKLLSAVGHTIRGDYEYVSNSQYIKNDNSKRLVAYYFYEHVKDFKVSDFEEKTISNYQATLKFCDIDKWFRI